MKVNKKKSKARWSQAHICWKKFLTEAQILYGYTSVTCTRKLNRLQCTVDVCGDGLGKMPIATEISAEPTLLTSKLYSRLTK